MDEQNVKQAAESVVPQVTELAQRMLGYLESGMDAAQEQMPLLLGEIIAWGIAEHLIIAAMFWVAPCVWVCVGMSVYRHVAEANNEGDAGFMVFVVSVLQAPLIIGGVMFFLAALKAVVAPRLYLIEYLRDLL